METENRLMYVIDLTAARVREEIYTKIGDLSVECYKTAEPVKYSDRKTGEHLTLKIGDKWGGLFDCAWFNFKGTVPETAKGKRVLLQIDVSGEGLIVDKDGTPLRGITVIEQPFDGRAGLAGKRIFDITDCAKGGEKIDIWMDAGCNCLFGSLKNDGCLIQADICIIDEKRRELFYDMQILIDLMRALNKESARYKSIFNTLHMCTRILADCNSDTMNEASALVKKELNKKCGTPSLKFTAIGHSHIDLAWLWPIRETIRKGARTFSTVLQLMDKYPDFKFGASQPQLYDWMKEYYPALYERIKEKIVEGRWEVQGCMWVEADMNLISGESMVRQILYGKKFFKDEFGIDVRHHWMPDVFGYSAALPQILVKSGCNYFMTQKLSWNLHNKFPHHTFNWRGIDGTTVLAHMLPEETYNSPLTPSAIKKAEKNYKQTGICEDGLVLFGIGDGGGGPGPEHLERAERLKSLNGLCPVKQDFAQPLFERLGKKSDSLPTWCGELYLERHQGTYTSSGQNKMYNRMAEIALHNLEFALVFSDADYPKSEIEKLWKEVLLYQFHDIIPGSSIKRVYDETAARYPQILERVNELTVSALKGMAGSLSGFNTLSWDREVAVEHDGKLYFETIPALGCADIVRKIKKADVSIGKMFIKNSKLTVKFGKNGSIVSVIDTVSGREALSSPSNIFSVYDETGLADCWDIDEEYMYKKQGDFKLCSQKFYVEGIRAVCEQKYSYKDSKLDVVLSLGHNVDRLEIKVNADWHEDRMMLRTAFNTTVLTDRATFEIQYGKISRPNNDNTNWQKAQFEVPAHRWVDLSEANYGVALLNNSKYGYRIKSNVIDMNLLRAQNYPGVNLDKGSHTFSYALYPHIGNEYTGEVYKQAMDFNNPVKIISSDNDHETIERGYLFKISNGIVIDTVKLAEDNDDIIVRLYEPSGATVSAELETALIYKNAYICDLMENIVEKAIINNNKISLKVNPFEVITLRLEK